MEHRLRDSYQTLGLFYDEVVGERKEIEEQLRGLLKRHAQGAKTLLEIACGTGANFEMLQKKYEVTGLDLSEIMLSQAAQKYPELPLYRDDMRTFSLGTHFDVVLCIFDSINHLDSLTDWKKTFRSVRQHLKTDGLFIFDVNTPYRLEKLSMQSALVHEADGCTYILDVERKSKNRFHDVLVQQDDQTLQ